MTYDEKIPEYALQPAKSADELMQSGQVDDGFDPTPYDRLLTTQKPEEQELPKERTTSREAELQELKETVEPVGAAIQDPVQETASDKPITPVQDAVEIAAEEDLNPVILEEEPLQEASTVPMNDPSVKITPLAGSAVYNDLKVTTVAQSLETKVFVEEDILVPDIKPDLISILSMDGKASLSSRELQVGEGDDGSIKVTGEVALQTIYVPESKNEEEVVSIIQSRLPFKIDWQVTASPMSHLSIAPTIERIDYTVVNERKFRAKVTLGLSLKEYAEKELQLFENLQGVELELRKENVKMSHVALRKEESVEIAEDLKLKDGSPRPLKILKSDVHVVENHQQITSEKMVINAAIWTNVLYLGEEDKEGEVITKPALYQGKTDFTQFILMNKEENVAMSRVRFSDRDLEIKINEEEDCFTLKGAVNTSVEILQNMEKRVVSDLYHNLRDTTYDSTESRIEAIIGTGAAEVSAREIFNAPEQSGQIEKIIYINGRIKNQKATAEQGRVMVEGTLEGQVLCIPEDEDKKPFIIKDEMGFRGAMEISSVQENMKVESQVVIKDLWFDKINSKQIEVNASLQIETAVIEEKYLKLIENPCFVESSQTKRPSSMVIYITKKNDSLWNIAKKYKTRMETIREINHLGDAQGLPEGTRLLIVK